MRWKRCDVRAARKTVDVPTAPAAAETEIESPGGAVVVLAVSHCRNDSLADDVGDFGVPPGHVIGNCLNQREKLNL